MIVVRDTSCITNLIAIGEETLLAALLSEVVIPRGVCSELQCEHEPLPDFIRIADVQN